MMRVVHSLREPEEMHSVGRCSMLALDNGGEDFCNLGLVAYLTVSVLLIANTWELAIQEYALCLRVNGTGFFG